MEASMSLSSLKLSWRPISDSDPCRRRARTGMIVSASREANGRDYGGKLVDESMIVLRMRIRDMKMVEMNNKKPPSNWMQWEKQYYAHYDEDVCEAVGLLQSYLMSVRPSIALGIVALVALSVPVSSGVVLIHAVEMVRSVFSSLV